MNKADRESDESGVLYVVATPIGNLEDITHRAVRIFGEVDYVLCEDTRVTGRLLKHYEVKVPLRRYDAHASGRVEAGIIADLENGKKVAMVCDAGTPSVSDPGVLLVAAARAAGCRVEAIPGASALTAAISIAGIAGNQFTFLGFIPHKKGRETFFKSLTTYTHPVAFYESTHRIMKCLASLKEHCTDKQVLIARELTKLHEEVVTGTAAEVEEYFENNADHKRGEFVVVVY